MPDYDAIAFSYDKFTKAFDYGDYLEKILSDISFEAPERKYQHIVINKDYVNEHLDDVRENKDLSQYIL